jgi:plasmid maintenance system antidote protein VapI
MRRRRIQPAALAEQLDGKMGTLRGLFAGSHAIDDHIAKAISSALGGTPDFWLRRQANYDKALDHVVGTIGEEERSDLIARAPTPGTRPRERISEVQRAKEIRRRLAYYNVNGIRAWNARYGQCVATTRFRTSGAFYSEDGAVSLWLRAGELEAELVSTLRWNPSQLRAELSTICRLSMIRQPDRFLPKLREILARVGVALVVQRAPRGCRASGASRFLGHGKALILLSLRYRWDDHFWFTLFHELGHLLLHGQQTFIDEDGMPSDELENEANEFARRCIVPLSRERQLGQLTGNQEAILRFSVSLGIAPGLIVGQMQHRRLIGYNRFNFLKRQYRWEDVHKAFA